MKTRQILCECRQCDPPYKVRTTRINLERGAPHCHDPAHGPMQSAWKLEADPWSEVGQADQAEENRRELERLDWALIRDDRVVTRVPHICDGCKVEHQRDEPMRYRVYSVEGEFYSVYTCFDCDSGAQTRGGAAAMGRL